jgi:hypothetical protein
MTGTPGHVLAGHFYEVTRPSSLISDQFGTNGPPLRWSFHHWSVQDNTAMPHLWEEALAYKESMGWTDENPVWRREFLGLWAADDTGYVYRYRRNNQETGEIWNVWSPEKEDISRSNPFGIPGDHEWLYVYGMDLGFRDPFALVILAYSPTSRYIYHCFSFKKKEMITREINELLDSLIERTGYPTSMVADITRMGEMFIREMSEVHGKHIEPAKQKNKNDGIELVNSDLVDGWFKVLDGSPLEEEMLHLQWDDTGIKERTGSGQRNDQCDATLYARERCHHHLSLPKQPERPKSGPEAIKLWEREEEEKASNEPDEETTWINGDSFDGFFET